MKITRTSILSKKTRTLDIDVTVDQMKLYQNGAHIQNAMPHLTDDEREFIMTGITPDEWDESLPVEESYDDSDDYSHLMEGGW